METQSKAAIVKEILSEELDGGSGQVRIEDLLRILAKIAMQRRVSFVELEEVLDQGEGSNTREIVRKSVDILRNRKHWIDAVDSPLPELSTYYMTAAGLSAIEK